MIDCLVIFVCKIRVGKCYFIMKGIKKKRTYDINKTNSIIVVFILSILTISSIVLSIIAITKSNDISETKTIYINTTVSSNINITYIEYNFTGTFLESADSNNIFNLKMLSDGQILYFWFSHWLWACPESGTDADTFTTSLKLPDSVMPSINGVIQQTPFFFVNTFVSGVIQQGNLYISSDDNQLIIQRNNLNNTDYWDADITDCEISDISGSYLLYPLPQTAHL